MKPPGNCLSRKGQYKECWIEKSSLKFTSDGVSESHLNRLEIGWKARQNNGIIDLAWDLACIQTEKMYAV